MDFHDPIVMSSSNISNKSQDEDKDEEIISLDDYQPIIENVEKTVNKSNPNFIENTHDKINYSDQRSWREKEILHQKKILQNRNQNQKLIHEENKFNCSICHKHAYCNATQCICILPLLGDGVYFCHQPFPIIQALHPNTCSVLGGCNVSIILKIPPHQSIKTSYCKYGDLVVKGKINDSFISCISPPHSSGNVPFNVAFFLDEWSEDRTFVFRYNRRLQYLIIYYSMAAFSGFILVLLFRQIKKLRRIVYHSDEDPFLLDKTVI